MQNTHPHSLKSKSQTDDFICDSQSLVFRTQGSLRCLSAEQVLQPVRFLIHLKSLPTSLLLLRSVFSLLKPSSLKGVFPFWIWVWTTRERPMDTADRKGTDQSQGTFHPKGCLQLGFHWCFSSDHRRDQTPINQPTHPSTNQPKSSPAPPILTLYSYPISYFWKYTIATNFLTRLQT